MIDKIFYINMILAVTICITYGILKETKKYDNNINFYVGLTVLSIPMFLIYKVIMS